MAEKTETLPYDEDGLFNPFPPLHRAFTLPQGVDPFIQRLSIIGELKNEMDATERKIVAAFLCSDAPEKPAD